MKKTILRKLRAMSNEILGEEHTNQIIEETVKEVLKETQPVEVEKDYVAHEVEIKAVKKPKNYKKKSDK